MILFGAPVLFLLLIAACVAAPASPRVDTSDPEVARRWYSLSESQGTSSQRWSTWPRSNDGYYPINYCFEDVHTHDIMRAMFKRALAKWAPALRLSALVFAPDPVCQQEPCLCSEPHLSETTLHIILAEGSSTVATSLGYRLESRDLNLPRHYLRYSTKPSFFEANGHIILAHELGKCLDGQLWRITVPW